MAFSPLIKDGALSLSETGDLQGAPDIVTQMTVTVGAYRCIYDTTIDSQLIPYLNTIQVGGINRNAVTNIIKTAFKSLIQQNVISNLTIAIQAQILSNIVINLTAVDAEGKTANLTWSNVF